jgi:hypothetical protein
MWETIKIMFSGKDDTSIKRVLAFMCFQFYFFMCCMEFIIPLTKNQVDMSNMTIYTGIGLIMGTMAEKFDFKSKKIK